LRLSWRAGPGRRYLIEVAASVAGPFEALPGFPRQALAATETLQLPAALDQRFYRVRLVPP
ncbi:MAG: hypothetical protein ACKO3N_14310, partial [Verrucomicrobiota bacterium]